MQRLLILMGLTLLLNQTILAAENPAIVLTLEEPKAGMTYQGVANLRGWAVAPIPLDRIEAQIDNGEILRVPLGGNRDDVLSDPTYGTYPNAEKAGFSMALNYGDYDAGNHNLSIRAYDINGDWREHNVAFQIVSFSDTWIETPSESVILDPQSAAVQRVDDSSFEVQGLIVKGLPYDLTLRWRTEQQGFAIESIKVKDIVDVSKYKSDQDYTVDYSKNISLAPEKTMTLKLANITEDGNKNDQGDGINEAKSNFIVKLPVLSDIQGVFIVENMTIASEFGPNDILVFQDIIDDEGDGYADNLDIFIHGVDVIPGARNQGIDQDDYLTVTAALTSGGLLQLKNLINAGVDIEPNTDGVQTLSTGTLDDAQIALLLGLLENQGTFQFEPYTVTEDQFVDVSQHKGENYVVNLSDASIAPNATLMLKLAHINAEGNMDDLGDGITAAKSDFTVKLPALSDIDGRFVIANMTIASAFGSNDILVFQGIADEEGNGYADDLYDLIDMVTVSNGAQNQGITGDIDYLTITAFMTNGGKFELENLINAGIDVNPEVAGFQTLSTGDLSDADAVALLNLLEKQGSFKFT